MWSSSVSLIPGRVTMIISAFCFSGFRTMVPGDPDCRIHGRHKKSGPCHHGPPLSIE
jgi:hypothetical protein